MEQYIPKSALAAKIERKIKQFVKENNTLLKNSDNAKELRSRIIMCKEILSFLDTLEVKEVDLKKLGEIARHLIAVKEHIEDMRLDKEEWLMLEKIGYPERFKAQKGEEV